MDNTEYTQQKQALLNQINELLIKIDGVHHPVVDTADSISEKVKRSVKSINLYAQNHPKTSAAAVNTVGYLARKWFKRGGK